MKLPITTIMARDIPDAWFQCINELVCGDYNKYVIQQGSYVGQTRLEFDWITIQIEHPYAEPYDLMLPQIPTELNIPNPVENGYVEQYLPYIMTAHKEDTEAYTYGQRMSGFPVPHAIPHMLVTYKDCIDEKKVEDNNLKRNNSMLDQITAIARVLKETPNTNQAVLQVAQPIDFLLLDPPCLRHIDMRVRDGKLVFYPYFRSWDLWGGFPANLAGIAVLQHFMADLIRIETGPIIAASKGLHIYGYVEELAKIRCHKE